MTIKLTDEQSHAIDAAGDTVVIDPRTRQQYRLVPEEVFRRLQNLYDASPWTSGEMAALAGAAFAKLDDDDYSHYLRDAP
ncbi:MAG: hypothetical protein ACJ8F7_10670 [Gemmataceae bacterium]